MVVDEAAEAEAAADSVVGHAVAAIAVVDEVEEVSEVDEEVSEVDVVDMIRVPLNTSRNLVSSHILAKTSWCAR